MSRLMPGRIRQEGIDLYDAGKLVVERVEDRSLKLMIDGEFFSYALEDGLLSCTCLHFGQRGYCAHLAATEYFLRNDKDGQHFLKELSEETESQVELVRRTYFGGQFLDSILAHRQETEIRYQLAVQGQLVLYDTNIDWTLKICRLPDQRQYIVRDIGAFLRTVQKGGYYQIGKSYYEPVSFEQFDAASQELLLFLWKLVPLKPGIDNDILLHFGRHLRLPLAYFEEGLDLLLQLSDFQFDYQSLSYKQLYLLPLDEDSGLFQFRVTAGSQLLELVLEEKGGRTLFDGQYLLDGPNLYYLDREQERLLAVLKEILPSESGVRKVGVEFQDQDRLALSLLDLKKLGRVEAPKRLLIQEFHPFFDFFLLEKGEIGFSLTLSFPQRRVESQEELALLPFAVDYQRLDQIFRLFSEFGFTGDFSGRRPVLSGQELYSFFTAFVPTLASLGQVKLAPDLEALKVEKAPMIRLERTGSLLDIAFDFEGIADEEIDQALSALLNEEGYYKSQSGQLLVFDEETQKISRSLQELRVRYSGKGHLAVQSFVARELEGILAGGHSVYLSESFRELVDDLSYPEKYSLPPLELETDLRDYQYLGVQWMSVLDKYGFGGVLADDMGLGKTLQTLAFLSSHLTSQSKVLILAPSSLIYNWQEECRRFAPHLDLAVVYGVREKRRELIEGNHQILVTSYSSFRQDSELYPHGKYDYLILDEAQVMKNSQTKIAQLLREFEVGNCFALSGTPIENNLSELWSLFQIILPGLLPNKTAFNKLTAKEVARMIQPFILRRRKEDVLQELPDLTEVTVLNELTDEQKAIYLAQLKQMQASIAGATDLEIQGRKIEILSGITRLRQICDTPSLFMDDYQGQSGKIQSLQELLLRLKEGKHRVLIFSQFRSMLEKIEGELAVLGLTSFLLTGSTPAGQRLAMTQAFNLGSRDVFLISLKAGGVGLNLTGADRVILVDLWWNPAVEAQAISRAHRMGQTEKVECYRLITRGTIEEKILALQEDKKNLVTTVLDGNESRSSLTVDELRDILGIT